MVLAPGELSGQENGPGDRQWPEAGAAIEAERHAPDLGTWRGGARPETEGRLGIMGSWSQHKEGMGSGPCPANVGWGFVAELMCLRMWC